MNDNDERPMTSDQSPRPPTLASVLVPASEGEPHRVWAQAEEKCPDRTPGLVQDLDWVLVVVPETGQDLWS